MSGLSFFVQPDRQSVSNIAYIVKSIDFFIFLVSFHNYSYPKSHPFLNKKGKNPTFFAKWVGEYKYKPIIIYYVKLCSQHNKLLNDNQEEVGFRLKKKLYVILGNVILILGCFLSGCGQDKYNSDKPVAQENSTQEELAEEDSQEEDLNEEKLQDESGNEADRNDAVPTQEKDVGENSETENNSEVGQTQQEQKEISVLGFDKRCIGHYEWYKNHYKMLVMSEYSGLTLSKEYVNEYPELAETLKQTYTMMKNSMEDEKDNLLSMAKEKFKKNKKKFKTFVSLLDANVRRADSTAVCFINDSFADYGKINEVRVVNGSSFDTATGERLMLSDVILDMESVPGLVEKELLRHMWNGDFISETVVSDYFRDTPQDGIRWTLDYNGVTFYFTPGEIAKEEWGSLSVTLLFKGNENIFEEKYIEAPDEYMVRLAKDCSFYTDIDNDGVGDELLVSGTYNKEDRFYSGFGIYTDVDSCYYVEEYFAYDFDPYYIKTADGKSFMYLFAEESEEDDRMMELVVLKLEKDSITKVGEMTIGPVHSKGDSAYDDIFRVPLNPDEMYLGTEVYRVGEDGMPVKR